MNFIFAYGALGLIVGSFLNVLIFRGGVQTLGGRSMCMSCGKKIHWPDLLPVISWILLRGRCRTCSSRISIQYPLVELSTAVLFACIGASNLPLFSQALGLPIAAVLIAITVYDIRHTIIPDSWVYTFDILAISFTIATSLQTLSVLGYDTSYWLSVLLAGPLAALPLFFLWLVSQGRWMGLGDAKLALGIGWLLGPFYGVTAIFLAFIFGAVIGLSLILFSTALWSRTMRRLIPRFFWCSGGRGFTMKSEVPFGPFLIVACLLVWFSLIYSIPIPFLWQ